MPPAPQEAHELAHHILRSAVDFAIIATDLKGRVSHWNPGATQILQWSPEEMQGRTADAFFSPEDVAAGRVQEEMRLSLAQGRAADERWHVRKDGTRFWASGEMMPLRDGTQAHIGYLKILRDGSHEQLAGMFEQAPTFMAILRGPEHRFERINPGYTQLIDGRDVLGLTVAQALPDAASQGFVALLDQVYASGQPFSAKGYRYAVQASPGAEVHERFVDFVNQPLRDARGRVSGILVQGVDVTERMRGAAALRESDERYRTLFEAMDEGFCLIEMLFDARGQAVDYRFIEANEVFSQQTGLGDPRGKTARELVPALEPVWFELYGKVAQTGKPLRFVNHAKAMGRWFDVSAFPIGEPSRAQVALLFRDITSRHVGETHRGAMLRLNDTVRDLTDPAEITDAACRILGKTLDASVVGYGAVDIARETISVERDWAAPGLTGLPRLLSFRDYGSYIDELLVNATVVVSDVRLDPRTSANPEELIAMNARSFVNMPVFERGGFVALLYVLCAEARVWTDAELALIREVAGRTRVAVERASADIERQGQAAELRALNNSLESQVAERTADRNALWQLSTDIMLRCAFDGLITAVNPAWTTLLGWREDELVGANLLDFIHPDDLERTAAGARTLAEGGSHGRFDNRYRGRDGRYRWISWSASPGGGVISAVGRDITAEIEAAEALQASEAALRQSQKMEAVGQLTGGLAHDFNNLLAGITGAMELMQIRLRQGRVNDLERYVAAAQGAAKRAAALTHRLLAFSRRQTLAPKPTDANRLVTGMEELIRRTTGPQITLEVVTAGGLWPTLVDPPQLENALLNLCINARDAMPDGGRITIETANKWLDERGARERDLQPGQYISLCVSDTGTGMTPEVIGKAFEPFFTTKPIGQGTGLGLSMIYGFVRQSGGQIRTYSELGQGTTMCLYLPRHHTGEEPAAPREPVGAPPRADQGETVLVVDDEPTVRLLITEVLDDLGYRAVEAEDGPAGLKVLNSPARIDLLITDVGLPGGMNGRQMADAARVGRPELRVLFITGYAENAVLGNGHLEPGMQVMTKPFAMDDLAGRIRSMISR